MAVAVGWSAAGVLLCVALVVDSLLPGGPRLPGVLVFAAVAGVVPALFVATAVVIAGKPRGRKTQTQWFVLLWRMPRRAKIGLGVPGAAALLLFFTSALLGAQGRADPAGDRLPFLAVAIWFYTVTAGVHLGSRVRAADREGPS